MIKNLLIILFTIFPAIVSAQWDVQNSGTNTILKSISFLNENTGWACGDDIVIKTTNGGATWIQLNVTGYHEVIQFVNENDGWICGKNGIILRSTDGGVTWNTQNSNVTHHLTDLRFYDESIGFVTGFGKTLLKTTNGGDNWFHAIPPGPEPIMHSLFILDENTVYASADLSFIYKSTNAGLTWDSLTLGMPNPFFSIFFINENTGWLVGCCGMYFKTTDAGISWTPETYLTPGFTIHSSSFINGTTGWVAAEAGYILRTTDAGENWDSLYSGTFNDLYSIQFVNDSTGWAVGFDGIILKTTNGGGPGWSVGVQQISSQIPSEYSLNQNYPNPFNPATRISFNLVKHSQTMLTVYNALGELVATLVNEELMPGIYEYSFNGSDLGSGIYYYSLISGEYTETRKMVLIK
mgnify:CR=1 FL=1